MVSKICQFRNSHIIPQLLRSHDPNNAASCDTIDLSCAENWFMKNEVLKRISQDPNCGRFVTEKSLSYSQDIGGDLEARKSIASLFNNHFHVRRVIDPGDIVLGAGASYVLDALIESICDPGDLVMIATPYWSGLDLCISIHNQAGVLPVTIPLAEFFTTRSLVYYEAAFVNAEHPVKAVLFCNPHNPLGLPYPREVLDAMISFCIRHEIHLISDEVYALSMYQPDCGGSNRFWSAFSTTQDHQFIHVVYSLSKDFGCDGVRMGALISKNPDVRLCVALSTHEQTSALTACLAATHILNEETINFAKDENRISLQLAYRKVVVFCRRFRIRYVPACAGMFVFARLCDGSNEGNFLQRLQAARVLLSTGTSYHFPEAGWFRICFGVNPIVLKAGLRKLGSILNTMRKAETVESPLMNSTPSKRADWRRRPTSPLPPESTSQI